MQNKKVTMLAAVLAVTVIAMAGVGYAVNYTAQTSNTNNTLEPTYIVLNQSTGAGAYTGFLNDLYYNTVNETNSSTVHYTPVYDYYANYTQTPTAQESKTLALVSKPVVLTITPTNSEAESVNLVVTADKYTGPATGGLTYKMVLIGANDAVVGAVDGVVNTTDETITWTFSTLGISKTQATNWNVKLFASGNVGAPASGFPDDSAQAKSTFTFVATA